MSTKPDKPDTPDAHTTLCSLASWADKHVSLRNVSSQFSLPTVARVVTGRYRGIAAADSKHHHHHHHHHSSSRRSSSIVFIQSVRTSQKVLMEAVKLQPNGRHVVSTGHNYSMPVTYGGWFEVLSEDGKAIEPVSTVAELASLWPSECVVREPLRVIVCRGAKHDDPEHMGSTRLDETRTVMAGELVSLCDVVDAVVEPATCRDEATNSADDSIYQQQQTRQYLRCVDPVGDSVFLDMNQRALLSPVAGPYNISGVHSVQSLLDKFRLPLIVRLVCGVIPTKLQKTFTSVFRLIGVYHDETAFILPLQASSTDSRMLSVSTREPLVFVGAANVDVVRQSPAFATVESRCSELVRAYMSSVHVLVAPPGMDALARGNQLLKDTQDLRHAESSTMRVDDDVGLIYDEIDDIYRYVRQGGEPPRPRCRLTVTAAAEAENEAGGPQPCQTGDQDAADYTWEEPIYEDIEKIRQRKRERATTTETTTVSAATTSTTTTMNDDNRRVIAGDVMPVGNLRQLIKRFSMIDSSTSSKPRPSPVRLNRTPPVPPKLTVDPRPVANIEQHQQLQDDLTTTLPRPDMDALARGNQLLRDTQDLRHAESSTTTHKTHNHDNTDYAVRQDTWSQSADTGTTSSHHPVCDDSLHQSAASVTSVRVSRDAGRRQPLQDASPYFCSRVSVGSAGSLSARPVVIDSQTTVTRITTLSRQSARRHDFNQQTA